MPTTTLVKPPSPLRTTGTALVHPLEELVEALEVKTDEDYEAADELLTRVRQAVAKWENKINPVIEPQRKALDAAYKLKNEFLHPLQAMEKAIKGEMATYKRLQLERVREAEAARQQEIDRLQREADIRAQQFKVAKTSPMKERLRQQREALAEQIAEKEQESVTATPIKVAGSQVRQKKKAEVHDIKAFMLAVVAGKIPLDLIEVNTSQLRLQFTAQPAIVSQWPGVKIVDDIVIAGR